MKMSQDYGGEYNYSPWCSFHPKELVVGICAVCLRERLLDLASLKQGQGHHHHHNIIIPKESRRRRKSSISLPRSVFALGSFLLRLDTRQRPDVSSDRGSIASLEDSFISIKFEDNGELTSWESKKKKKKKKEKDSAITNTQQQGKVLLKQHPKPRLTSLIRWRKRMDQLLQLVVRWKRRSATTSSGGSHVAMAAKVEVGRRKRRMRNLTARRRTRES